MRDLVSKSLGDAFDHIAERGVDLSEVSQRATRSEKKRDITDIVEVRTSTVEQRAAEDGYVTIAGYAATFDTWYDVAGGAAAGGWSETIARGAVDKSITEMDDVRMLVNHDGLALARSTAGSLTLRADEIGIYFEATMPTSVQQVRDLVALIEEGAVDQCSWAFMVTRQTWNADYTERTILEAKMYDVSVVTYPANTATIVGVRADDAPVKERNEQPAVEVRDIDLGRYTPRQVAQYNADEALVGLFGQYDQTDGPDGAHYMMPSPFPYNCSACAFYDGARACEIVAGDIDPAAICKRWIVPADLISLRSQRSGIPLSLAIAQAAALG
jgi:HK97 family phage prohead protease